MENNDFVIKTNAYNLKSLVKYQGNDSVITVPKGVEFIEYRSFADLDFIDTVIMADSVLMLSSGCFSSSSVRRVVFPKSVHSIGGRSFENCKNLKTLVIENPEISFGVSPFKNASTDFEIIFSGTCQQFDKAASNAYGGTEEYQSGDYHHPSSTRFEYRKYKIYEHIFSDTLNTPFTCTVKCADGELVYHEMEDKKRKVEV